MVVFNRIFNKVIKHPIDQYITSCQHQTLACILFFFIYCTLRFLYQCNTFFLCQRFQICQHFLD